MRLNDGIEWHVELVSPPKKEPMEITDFRDDHLRVLSDEVEAEYMGGLIKAGRIYFENWTRTKAITQTQRMYMDRFPPHQIELPFPPMQSIVSIKYIDSAGVLTTWPNTSYKVSPPESVAQKDNAKRCRIRRAFGVNWPDPRQEMDAVQIEFTCGYGDDGTDVPEPIRQGIKMVAAEMYLQRRQSLHDIFQHPAVISAENLWWRYRRR